MKEILTKVM